MNAQEKYSHLETSLNTNLLQFYDSAFDSVKEETIAQDLASIDKRYVDFELIAEGGTKSVYKAVDNVVKRPIAYAQLIDNSEANHESFLREARLTSLLHHPGIISVLDMGLEEEKPFFTMELKVGHSLGYILKRLHKNDPAILNKYSIEKLLNIFLRICDAIAYAHSKEIIHLDLKPDNIQIGEFGEVVICDWGLGKLLSAPEKAGSKTQSLLRTQTLNGVIKGTPGFMAPEQVLKSGSKTFKTDIYALGAILYNILTLAPPCTGEVEEILKDTASGNFKEPSELFESIPAGLNAVTMKALETKAAERYDSVEELRNEVEMYLGGYAPDAENASLLKLALLFYRRHKALCVTLISAVIIFFISSLFFMNRINNEKNEAVKQKGLTEKALVNEQNARESAERALNMYEEQKTLTTDYKTRILNTASFFLRKKMFHPDVNKKSFTMIIRDMKILFEREPDDQNVRSTYGYLLFSMHNFKEASEVLKTSERFGYLRRILKDFNAIAGNKSNYTVDEICGLMKLLSNERAERGYSNIVHLLRYQSLKLQPEFHKAVKTALDIFNGGNVSFNYNFKNNYLEVGSGKTLTLSYNNYNFLRILKVRHLKVNGVLKAPETLTQLRVHIMDISDCTCENYKFLTHFFSVKELTVKKGQLTPELKPAVEKYITVFEK